MFSRILKKSKVVLLLSSFRHGPLAIAKQIYLLMLDSMIREKHLVFRLFSKDIPDVQCFEGSGFSFREISSWEDFNAKDQYKIFDKNSPIDIGSSDWFDRGWRLWIGELDGSLAALGWWRSAKQSRDFFCAIPEKGELLWHATTLPAFRGKGLHVLLRITMMRERQRKGVESFYINCRDYNTPSYRNILKMEFRCIGYCTINKWTKRRTWHPVSDRETPT